MERSVIGGRDVTEQFQRLLQRSGCNVGSTSAEMEVVRAIKEQAGYVAYSAVEEEEQELWRGRLPNEYMYATC